MNCPICGKQVMYNNGTCYTVSTVTQSGTAYLSSDYCYGMCAGIVTTAYLQVGDETLPLHNFQMDVTLNVAPIREQPLEWAEVERQLDDFMNELNERDNDDPT